METRLCKERRMSVRTWEQAGRCRCGWKINLLVSSWNGYGENQAYELRTYEEGKHREITTQTTANLI